MARSEVDPRFNSNDLADALSIFRPHYPYLTPTLTACIQQAQDERHTRCPCKNCTASQGTRVTASETSNGAHMQPPAPDPRARIRSVLPDILCCGRCNAQLAFTSQIVARPVHIPNRLGNKYLLAPPPLAMGSTLAPVFDPEPVDNGAHGNEIVTRYLEPVDHNSHRHYYKYELRRRRDNLHNIILSSPMCAEMGLAGLIVCSQVACGKCGDYLGFKYIDVVNPDRVSRIGMFLIMACKVVVQHSYEFLSDATVAAMDRNIQRGLAREESSLVSLDNIDGARCFAEKPAPPPPHVAAWASRSGGAFSLAERDPLGAVRSLQAQRNHRLCIVECVSQYRADRGTMEAQHLFEDPDPETTPLKTWGRNKNDATHIPDWCFTADEIAELCSRQSRCFDDAESRLYNLFNLWFSFTGSSELLPAYHAQWVHHRLTRRGYAFFYARNFSVRERRGAIAPLTIEFDSDDEDECDALFCGIWNPREVAIHRKQKKKDAPVKLRGNFLKAIMLKKAAVIKLHEQRQQYVPPALC